MRSWLFGVLLSESAERAPDADLTDRYTAENRFEVDGQCGALVSEGDGCPPTGVSTKGSHFTSITVAELIPTVFQELDTLAF